MKLKRVGEIHGNRTGRAGEVLRSPEQPRKEPWDVHDPELFSRWLGNAAEFSNSQLRYAVVDLGMINPSAMTPEIRAAVVAAAIEIMEKEVDFWKKGGQRKGWGLSKLADHMLSALLVDPQAHFQTPQQFWDEMHQVMQEEDQWYRNFLRVYALQFPGKLDPLAEDIAEYLIKEGLEVHRQAESGPMKGHDLAADFATLRLVAPQHFSEALITPSDYQEIQGNLSYQRRQTEQSDVPETSYPEDLFLAMVALADEVSFSPETGLQIRFTKSIQGQAPGLPERPQFS